MWILVLLIPMITVTDSEADSGKIEVSSYSDESVVLPPEGRRSIEHRWDVRWTHTHLVLKNNMTMCHHGRCELLSDGSLRFNSVQTQDSGIYTLEVFHENGTRLMRREFSLRVVAADASGRTVAVAVSISCLLLLLPIIIFILRRRRRMSTNTSGSTEENEYVKMLTGHGHKEKDDAEMKQEKEDPVYVLCHPAVSSDAPKTQKTEEADVYV